MMFRKIFIKEKQEKNITYIFYLFLKKYNWA